MRKRSRVRWMFHTTNRRSNPGLQGGEFATELVEEGAVQAVIPLLDPRFELIRIQGLVSRDGSRRGLTCHLEGRWVVGCRALLSTGCRRHALRWGDIEYRSEKYSEHRSSNRSEHMWSKVETLLSASPLVTFE